MKIKKPKLYKFTFYGTPSHWPDKEPDVKEILKNVEECLCYVDDLNQVTKVQLTKQSIKDS